MSSDIQWMVGVRLRSAAGRPVSYFCLVDGTVSGTEARSTAVSRMAGTPGMADRVGTDPDDSWVQVQRVVHDPLGRITLSAPLPHGGAAPRRGPVAPLTEGTS
ncbi:hypothetical protein [Streptomyces fagopyri]|uniref:hypothetical protein n=1 Tax=Streptomyces fagopyri TaxID=2662397 RepID=UPI001885A63E|nr:hypothetical protein [Streptomyces fagopyri]